MIIGIGIDIVEVRRISAALQGTQTMAQKVFTADEIRYCTERKNKYQHFSGRFAAKEAALKALGTGWSEGIRWKDVEVTNGELGKPGLTFYGKAKEVLEKSGAQQAWLSITHSPEHSVAVVVLEK
ncbi:holo-ACP synthase [Acidobacteria bacterium AH-259-G07]|nr:holo-ACP synthase [Acidobacteria bacterium AH-259-G07]